MALNFLVEIIAPNMAYALTSGPSQPEVQSFEPVGTTEMVDLFTGDFTYNIPLFEVPGPDGGYPFNLAYHSGVGMDQEASWTGLGWNLNAGAIVRQMRGLPDEFKGDNVTVIEDMKNVHTFGVNASGDVEVFGKDSKLSLRTSLGVYYHSMNGLGYKLGADLGVELGKNNNTRAGLGLSLDTQNGVDVSPSLSYSHLVNEQNHHFTGSLTASLNSRAGLQGLSLGTSVGEWDKDKKEAKRGGISGGTSLSFASLAKMPSISREMESRGINFQFGIGTAFFGVFSKANVGGFYNVSYLKNRGDEQKRQAYGYLHLQSSGNDNSMKDFSLGKAGVIHKDSPNLPIPSHSYDVYSVSGQGISAMYRPYRSDIGIVHDPYVQSRTVNVAVGTEAGLPTHVGVNASGTVIKTRSGKWEKENSLDNQIGFTAYAGNDVSYEPYYFKSYGDPTTDRTDQLNYIGNEKPVYVSTDKKGAYLSVSWEAENFLKDKNHHAVSSAQENFPANHDRERRNEVVQPITNEKVIDKYGDVILGEYAIDYYDLSEDGLVDYKTPISLDRTSRRDNHHAGFTSLNASGQRYVYALPAYNKQQSEYLFSVDESNDVSTNKVSVPTSDKNKIGVAYEVNGTNKYAKKTTIPQYPHSYLLTSILGADYVDVDNIPGPSDGDFGYWVKFEYAKANDYKWRAPFNGANYIEGTKSSAVDDQGAFTYGEKETWYLTKVQTKSHVAVFDLSKRQDGRGVGDALGDNAKITKQLQYGDFGAYSYKVDQISLYTKAEYQENESNRVPIKTVHFDYTYDLCGKVDNNYGEAQDNSEGVDINKNEGKLTLKKLWFTHRNSRRGALSPYEFDYEERDANGDINLATNPNYHTHLYDRWGNYKDDSQLGTRADNAKHNMDFPYVKQNDEAYDNTEAGAFNSFKKERDNNAAVWNLKKIKLPSGGDIEVQYESDDYAYVQNRIAMQMTPVAALDQGNKLTHNGRRVYFDLERPIPTSANIVEEVGKYFEGTEQVYIKALTKLKKHDEPVEEFISIYADINKNNDDWCGVDKHPDFIVDGKYTRGFVRLEAYKNRNTSLHPLAMAGWQFLRLEHPMLLNTDAGKISASSDDAGDLDKIAKARALLNSFGDFYTMFRGYYNKAKAKEWSQHVKLEKTWIRLNTVDKIKYGGGLRVKQITLRDNWAESTGDTEESSFYGQVYDYTMLENEQVISSGVATYEPFIGGDEIPLRESKPYVNEIPLRVNDNFNFELPVNENLYPGPSVGYRKVRVKSIASHYAGKRDTDYPVPNGIMTTGAVEHEFYTAKEFPVICDETDLESDHKHPALFIPFIGSKKKDKYVGSQGYSIELNDMHGKPKQISYYRDDKTGRTEKSAYNWVKYHYKADKLREQGFSRLNNEVEVLTGGIKDTPESDGSYQAKREKRTLGVDYDFVVYMQQNRTASSTIGAVYNTDVVTLPPPLVPIPVPTVWPEVLPKRVDETRIAVTNKVLHKFGILEKVEAYNEGSRIETKNVLWDGQTGQALLTQVTNNYDAPVYKYSMPARWKYEGMGAAYKNIGMNFRATVDTENPIVLADGESHAYKIAIAATNGDKLVPGDEFVIDNTTAVYTGKNKAGDYIFDIENVRDVVDGKSDLLLTRSGRRNHLGATYQSLVALEDPTKDLLNIECSKSIDTLGYVPEIIGYKDVHKSENLQVVQDYIENINNMLSGYYEESPPRQPASWPTYDFKYPVGYETGSPVSCGGRTALHYNNYPIMFYGTHDTEKPEGLNYANYPEFNCSWEDGIAQTVIKVHFIDCGKDGWVKVRFDRRDIYNPDKLSLDGWLRLPHKNNSCRTWVEQEPIYADDIRLGSSELKLDQNVAHNLLQISANTFTDNQLPELEALRAEHSSTAAMLDFQKSSTFRNGSKGIWRPESGYVYKTERSGKKNTADIPNLAKDGTFTATLFDPANPFMEDCDPNWIRTNTVSKYNGSSYGTESNDALDNKSAALYGYEGRLSTMVASNAQYNEIAFESFEELDQIGGDFVDQKASNVDFFSLRSVTTTEEHVEVFEDPEYGSRYINPGGAGHTGGYIHGYWGGNVQGAKEYITIPGDWRGMNPQLSVKGKTWTWNGPTYGPDYNAGSVFQGVYQVDRVEYDYDPVHDFEEYSTIYLTEPLYNTDHRWTGTVTVTREVTQDVSPSSYTSNQFDIESGNGNLLIVDQPYDQNNTLSKVFVSGSSLVPYTAKEIQGYYAVTKQEAHPTDPNKSIVELDEAQFPYTGLWKGILLENVSVAVSPTANVNLVTDKAHTGKQSAKISGGAGSIQLSRMQLQAGKKYMVSAWVALPSLQEKLYEGTDYKFLLATPPSFSLNLIKEDGTVVPNNLQWVGKTIKGWQKIEAEVIIPEGVSTANLFVNVGDGELLIDDIRVHPYNSGVNTYVYDWENYRLSAVLDDRNYATFYYYDEQGNLYLTKKETERGIKTIQDVMSHTFEK